MNPLNNMNDNEQQMIQVLTEYDKRMTRHFNITLGKAVIWSMILWGTIGAVIGALVF